METNHKCLQGTILQLLYPKQVHRGMEPVPYIHSHLATWHSPSAYLYVVGEPEGKQHRKNI